MANKLQLAREGGKMEFPEFPENSVRTLDNNMCTLHVHPLVANGMNAATDMQRYVTRTGNKMAYVLSGGRKRYQ